MSILLFSLRSVPEDEADDIRALLDSHAIAFYETPPGNWGISMPAIWLNNDENLVLARQLLADYQQQRFISQRQQYLLKKQAGETPTFIGNLLRRPLHLLTYLLGIFLILYASVRLIYAFGY
jgi:hypothetical protein